MKNKLIYSMLVLLVCISLNSCDDFIAIELDDAAVTIITPANNTVSSSFSQLFKWEPVAGAEKYELEIVKPNFAAIQQFVMDTTTTSTQFSCILSPGTYQWRLRAVNNVSQTQYVTYNLTIDSTLDLSFSTLQLSTPSDNYYSKLMTNTFSWLQLPNADTYVLQVLSGSTVLAPIQSFTDPVTTGDFTFTAEGTYQWRVYAQNSSSVSAFMTRTIVIDTTAPATPVPAFPMQDTITANPIPLQWNTTTGADSSHIVISAANDSLFLGPALKDTMIERTGTLITYNFYSAVAGQKYFWKVQDVDKAGNKSAYFTRRRIKRN